MSAEMHAMVGAYALDALDHHEQVAFEAHLAGCPSCSDELAEFSATAERLGSAVALTPPASLRATVLAAVATTPQERRVIPLRPAERWRRRAPVLLAAASVLAVVSVLGIYIGEHNRLSETEDQRQLEAQVLAADDAVTTAERIGDSTRVKVIASDSMDSAVVVMRGVPPLAEDDSYQMWAVGPDQPQSLGVMGNDDVEGTTSHLVEGIRDADVLAITVEPEGGSEQPTDEPIITVDLV